MAEAEVSSNQCKLSYTQTVLHDISIPIQRSPFGINRDEHNFGLTKIINQIELILNLVFILKKMVKSVLFRLLL